MNEAFWSVDDLDLEDSLNCEIWRDSPEQQEQIQPYKTCWEVGAVGAQQAMRSPYRLPWVPDPVGRDWKSRDALFVFGSTYGPFVGGHGQVHEMRPADYDQRSSGEFLRHFFRDVIENRLYYKRIAGLASAVIPSCRLLAPVDLCRVAFVRRNPPRDKGGDSVINLEPEVFSKYVESETASDWLWRRLLGSEASALIALGTVAEHGLLRLFRRHLGKLSIRDSHDTKICFSASDNDIRWPSRHAHGLRTLTIRKNAATPPFWNIEGEVAGLRREWRLAVVPHPTGARGQWSDYPMKAARAIYIAAKERKIARTSSA